MKFTIHNSLLILIASVMTLTMMSCIEDGFTTDRSAQPVFSVDTLDMGTIFTDQPSTTHRFTVYNRADKGINISSISITGDNSGLFRLNVDGFSGTEFSNVEIRANDSIFVLVETTLPANGLNAPVDITARLEFLTNGASSEVVLKATGRDVTRLRGEVFTADATLTADRPYQIYDSLVVAKGATLTIEPGTELYFHDGALMIVRGSLKALGECGREIILTGDRTGYVAADIPFDIMSRQWTGLFFTSTSTDNVLHYTHVCNTWQGVTIDGSDSEPGSEPSLTIVNSRLRNSQGYALEAIHARVKAYGSEFAEGGQGAVLLHGGNHVLNHCTLSNYYLFSALGGPILQLSHIDEDTDDGTGRPTVTAQITNSIIYGLGRDISHGDLTDTGVSLRRCLLKSAGNDDDNFIDCIWDSDPLFYTVREDYVFDYRLRDESPAIGSADASLTAPESHTDRLGNPRGPAPDLGAYVYNPSN